MARRLFILFGIVVFAAYCWASVVYQNVVDVPDYKLVEVDLLQGMPREKWDANPQDHFQTLMELETKSYQLPTDTKLGISPDKPLTSGDFAKFIADAPPGQPVKMTLRDSDAINDLVSRNYVLRDSIHAPSDKDFSKKPIHYGGYQVDKWTIDKLREEGIRSITVVGHGRPVNFQVGTALMIALIFFVLVAALKPILWEPFRVMLEKRKWEMEMGAEAERQTQAENVRFEAEKRRRTGELDRDIQALRMKEQRETAGQVGAIVNEAKEKGKTLKAAGLQEIGQAAREARERMEEEVPALALAVADMIAPKKE